MFPVCLCCLGPTQAEVYPNAKHVLCSCIQRAVGKYWAMGADTKTEDPSVASITENMEEWAENVTLSYKNSRVLFIMQVDGIIKHKK